MCRDDTLYVCSKECRLDIAKSLSEDKTSKEMIVELKATILAEMKAMNDRLGSYCTKLDYIDQVESKFTRIEDLVCRLGNDMIELKSQTEQQTKAIEERENMEKRRTREWTEIIAANGEWPTLSEKPNSPHSQPETEGPQTETESAEENRGPG
jgi:predicted P-loop ATPase